MFNSVKIFSIFVVAGLLLPEIAPAKVQHIHKYKRDELKDFDSSDNHKQGGTSQEEKGVACEAYGWYTEAGAKAIFGGTIPTGACSTMTLSDRTCYKCECPKSYQYICDKTGFKPASGAGSCRLRGATATLYTACDCDTANGYLLNSQFNPSALGLFSYGGGTIVSATGSNGGAEKTCYLVTGFGNCNTGGAEATVTASSVTKASGNINAVTLTVSGESNVTYTAKPLLNSASTSYSGFSNKYCTTAASISSPLMDSLPTGDAYKCAQSTSGQTYYHPHKTYYYYTGCSTSAPCVSNDEVSDCLDYQTQSITLRTGGTVTCKRANGCLTGVPQGKTFLCASGDVNPNGTYFAYTTINSGGQSCKKITGCTSPYENKYLNNGTPGDYTKDNNYTYSVQKLTSGTGAVVCAMPTGCRMDLGSYDYACPTGCWGGWLSLWAKAAGK